MSDRILIVEDDPDIAETIEYNLQEEGYSTRIAGDGLLALKEVEAFRPQLIVLDVMLPGMNGLEICKRLKADRKTSGIAILMLTVRSSDMDVVSGLESGADDYVSKPFSMKVLSARIRNLLRRERVSGEPEIPVVQMPGLSIDRMRFEVVVEGKLVAFSKTEFEILSLLASRPGKVFSRDAILEQCWPEGVLVVDRSVDVHINSIRKKLGPLGNRVETVRGVGYRMGDVEA